MHQRHACANQALLDKLYRRKRHEEFLGRCRETEIQPKFTRISRKVKKSMGWSKKKVRQEEKRKLDSTYIENKDAICSLNRAFIQSLKDFFFFKI